ncbi:phage tail tape measure protein [Solibacillus isronensis]|uniref:phage tail tape measure protein n=1 Tax=Solibacillus isronensis TaxID=412383 RepID=UPI0039A32576
MVTGNIKGITIELDGDTSGLQQALKKVDNETKSVQNELRQVDKLLKFDPSNVELLQQKQKLLGDAIDGTSKRLGALKQAQSEVERQFQSGEIGEEAYRKFQREIIATEGKLKAFQSQADSVKVKIDAQTDTSGLDKMTDKLEEVSRKAQEVGGKMKDVGSEMSTKLSAPLAALGGGALLAAGQFDNAAGQIQAALGVTADEAAALEDKATSLWKAGFGESLEEVSNGLIRVKQNFHNLDDGEIEEVTKNSLALAKSFDSDVNEVTRAASNLITNFGVSSEEAFDMMAKGAQNGLNFSNEMFDNLSEYAPLFGAMGYSAEEYFGILERGAKAGVYNLDYVNDVMKEFQIRIKDNSDKTSDYMSLMSQSTLDLWEAQYQGKATVAEVASSVIKDLQAMDNQVDANEIGVALFGTKWEDLESKAMYAMLGSTDAMKDFEGAMDSVSVAQEKTFGQRWESFIRNATASLEPLGKILLNLAEQWLPKVILVVEGLSMWFANLSPVMQGITVAMGAVVAASGPILVVFGAITSGLSTLIPLLASSGTLASGFGTALAVMTGPIGLTVAAIAGLGLAIFGLGTYFNQSSLEIESWEGQVSEGTAKAVGSFMKLYDEASLAMANLSIGNQVVTQEMATNMIAIYDQMGQQVLAEMQSNHTERLAAVTDFYANSGILVESEEAKILAKTAEYQSNQEKQVSEGNERIKEILTTASTQKRELTLAEQAEINRIQGVMKDNAIQYLTETELEQRVILETMKNNASEITAQQAAEVVKNSVKQKDEVVAEAQEQYEKAVAEIIKQRDEMGVISGAQAKQLIEDAGKQRDETIKAAQEMHTNVVSEAKKQAGEHVDQVEWGTGEIKSKWQVMKQDISKRMKEIGADIKRDWTQAYNDANRSVSNMAEKVSSNFQAMGKNIGIKMNEAKDTIVTKWNEAAAFLKGIDLLQIGKEIVNGLIKGIGDKFGGVQAKIEELAGMIPTWAKDVLGIKSPSRVMMEIGKWTGEGLALGINDTQSTVRKAIEELSGILIDVAENNVQQDKEIRKKADADILKLRKDAAEKIADLEKKSNDKILGIQESASKKKKGMTATQQRTLVNTHADTAAKILKIEEDTAAKIAKIDAKAKSDSAKLISVNQKEVLEEIKLFISDKQSLEQMNLIQEAAIWAKSIELFEDGTKERVEAQKAYQKSLETINSQIVSTNQQYQTEIKRISDDLIKAEADLTKAYDDAVNNRANSLKSFASTFDAFTVEVKQSGLDLTANLQSQVDAIKLWQEEFAKISSRGINGELLDELSELGVKALPELIALNQLTDEQLSEYSALYQEKSQLARTQAETELIGMKTDTQKKIDDLRKAANAELTKLQADWDAKIKGITQGTKTELSTLKQIGVDAGQGLLNGLASMQGPLIDKAREIANAISRTIQSALAIHSPSRVMKGFGINIGEGLIIGMDEMINKVAQSSARLSEAVANTQASLASSAQKSMQYGSSITSSTSTVDNRKTFAPVVHINTTNSGDKAMERTLRRLAFQFN